jgi:hypothetical protein
MPSNGQMNVPNAASTRAGLAIQTMSRPSRGKSPPNMANKQPILLLTSCLVSDCPPPRGGYRSPAVTGRRLLLPVDHDRSRSARSIVEDSPRRPGALRARLEAHQIEPQTAYAFDDAVEVGLVDDLPR